MESDTSANIQLMDANKRYLARTRFKLEVFESKGTSFQHFFEKVMTKAYPDFQIVKPQGRRGDEKNDGFVPTTGTYYQVYAPENPTDRVSQAIKKCEEDFEGLVSHWGDETAIKEFFFVFNDEYRGGYPELHHTIASMQQANPDIKIGLFLPKDLEDIFLNLSEEKICDVIDYIPDPSGIDTIDYDVLTEVLNHILSHEKLASGGEVMEVPDFDQKISFNGLSPEVAILLKNGSFQASVLYEFFENNSGFSRQDLQLRFVSLYEKGKREIAEDVENRSDVIFLFILKESLPKLTKSAENAVLVLMSYFFESCDIFEEPK